MASKDHVLRALSGSHLRAIGKVAAQWSSLETSVLSAISDISQVSHHTVLVMIGTQGFRQWFEILRAVSGEHLLKRPKPLGALWSKIEPLQKRRNEVVHCNWMAPISLTPGIGLLGASYLPTPAAHEQARGYGISRSKAAPVMPIAFSAREMLSVAREIEAAERALNAWLRQWKKTRPIKGGRGLLESALPLDGS